MIYSNWILFFPIFLLSIEKVHSSTINFIARYSSQNLELVCDLRSTDAIGWNIYLSCPFTNSGICYSNCKSTCENPDGCLPMITKCVKEKNEKNHIVLKWTIDVTKINKVGEWKCSNRDIYSNAISLEKYGPKHSITHDAKEAKIIKSTITPAVTSQTDIELPEVQEKNSYYQTSKIDFWRLITQPKIVLVLICVFTLSLVLNIIFLIRCALFRSVIDNYLQAKKSPDSCLFRCFCIPVNNNLPTVNMKSIHQTNPSAYIAYHRDEIYDDMSSGSQADRHLINNYSHYELEHDSVLSRKVWSTDGSHNVINRQSNICPGQPMGNYVIVAGPVCTNRNHIALNTPSNASLVSNSQHTYTTDAMGRSLSNEFPRPEYCTGSDNVIYSQPLKNRTRSFDPALNDEVSVKYMANFKPVSHPQPPERNSNEQIHQIVPLVEPLSMNTVDLIEHYTHASNGQTMEEKSSLK